MKPEDHDRSRTTELRFWGLLTAGVVDSTGLAFGWTIVLLVVTDRGGLAAAAGQSAAMLVGVAMSAPFSDWISARLAQRDLLRVLAVTEGVGRAGMFVLLWVQAGTVLLAPVVAVTNVLAFAAFAAMRAEVARAGDESGPARSSGSGRASRLTAYAVAIASSEALAAGAAALLFDGRPSAAVMVLVAAGYVLSLLPQWWVGSRADSVLHPRPHRRGSLRVMVGPAGLGAGVFLLAGAPALLATVLAHELYGPVGVMVSAIAFTTGSLGATALQPLVGVWRIGLPSALLLGAVMVGGWSLSGHGLIGLAFAQGCAGLGQCTLEGDLDARVTGRLPAGAVTAGLAVAASARALGGAVSVALLPHLLHHCSLSRAGGSIAGGLLGAGTLAALVVAGLHLRHHEAPTAFVIGYAAGVVTSAARDVSSDARLRIRQTVGATYPSIPAPRSPVTVEAPLVPEVRADRAVLSSAHPLSVAVPASTGRRR